MNNTVIDSKTSMAPRYKAYKDSGIAWLGEIPAHWKVKKVTRLFKTIGSGTTPPSGEDRWYNGSTHWVTTSELRETIIYNTKKKVSNATLNKFTTLKVYPPGTTLIAMYGATIGRLGILGVKACTNQACCALSEPINTDGKFIYYWLWGNKAHIINLSSGGGQPNINQDKVSELRVSIPPLPEQQAIAAYLDYKTAKLDKLIANKREQIKQLETLRKVTIQDAVTKGLNPDAPMKDSGIAWLGEIPSHWKNTLIKRHYSVQLGKMLQPSAKHDDDTKEKYLRAANIQWAGVDVSDVKTMWFSAYEKTQYVLQQGDLLISEGGDVGRAVIWDRQESDVYIQNAINRVRGVNFSSSKFLFYWIFTVKQNGLIEVFCNKSTIPHYTAEKVGRTQILFPPLPEQRAIAAYLDYKTAKLDKLIANNREQITQLETLRKVTIHDAVTGKINVSGLEV